jgi:hypothetical protein
MTWLDSKGNSLRGDGGIEEGTLPAFLADHARAKEYVIVQ